MNTFEHVQRPGVRGGPWEGYQCGKGAKSAASCSQANTFELIAGGREGFSI